MALNFGRIFAGESPKLCGKPAFPRQSGELVAFADAAAQEISDKEKQEFMWRGFFLAPAQWWDNRQDKKRRGYPDFRHKWSREALWLDNRHKPAWVDAQLAMWEAQLASTASSSSPVNDASQFSDARSGGNLVTWTRICEDGQLPEAVDALSRLVQQGLYVDNSLFYLVLKRCFAEKNLVLGRRVHSLSLTCGYESDSFLANHIIRMYASHGMLEEAMDVFTKVAAPDTYMWASIILAYAERGKPSQAIELYRQMRHRSSVKPNNHIFVAVLKACTRAGNLEFGKAVHADISGSSEEPNTFVGNSLVDMYAKCGNLVEARKVFDSLQPKNVVTWNAMIGGYALHGFIQEALALYASMKQEGDIAADPVTFVCLLKVCTSAGALDEGKKIHTQIKERGLEADVVVGNCLVDMYAKCGCLQDAHQVFNRLPSRDVVTWTAMLTGYTQRGLNEEALTLYSNMQQGGITLVDHYTFPCLLKACSSVGALHYGMEIHAQIRESGLESDAVIGNCLVDMYAKCGSLEDARRVFDRLPCRDVVTWNAMLAGYAQHGLGQQALCLYASMEQESGVEADHFTFACLLQACAMVAALDQGKQLHARICELGLEHDVVVGTCLVDMYAKCARLSDARKVFDALPARDVVTWNALLNGYAQHSDGQMAIQCFKDMRQQGVEPDDATFVCLLVACSHEGLVNEGQQYFRMMVEEHGIAPSFNHSNCMVDLLGRSGRLNEAEHMLLKMPGDNVVGWTSLLSACKSHADKERGRRCFEHLTRLEPENAAPYVLLGNIYANAGRWMEVEWVEKLRKCAGAKKKPAKACIEVDKRVHEFVVGEERGDISSKLRSMNVRLKDGGHRPHTELVLKAVSEKEKEDALCGHAEKLALAYGLMNTPDGTTLLVTKNLRMCNDCHSGTKVMSVVEKREIVVRDAHRVHRFSNGSCSCGDRH